MFINISVLWTYFSFSVRFLLFYLFFVKFLSIRPPTDVNQTPTAALPYRFVCVILINSPFKIHTLFVIVSLYIVHEHILAKIHQNVSGAWAIRGDRRKLNSIRTMLTILYLLHEELIRQKISNLASIHFIRFTLLLF